ncbi:MAG: glycoside hydrolase domain-containing protein, partial [Ginsengibacter sp.]
MKKHLLTALILFFCGNLFSQTIPYKICNNCWNADSLGNHRVVVSYSSSGKIAKATIPWRRRDHHPEVIRIIVQDAKTGNKIENVKTGTLDREFGEVYFEPVSGKGEYYIYYLPYKNEGSANYPNSVYLKPEKTASEEWLQNLSDGLIHSNAAIDEFQAIDSFNTFYPMEVIATDYEMNRLRNTHSSDAFLIFPEDRLHSIRMGDDLPDRWIEKGPKNNFRDTADKGENFAFQLGIYALRDLKNVQVSFSNLRSDNGEVISLKNISCLNTSGTTYDDKPLSKVVNIDMGKVQPLWCMIDVPLNASPGNYKGSARVLVDGLVKEKMIDIELTVSNSIAKNNGVDEPWKMTRLKWLNSELAQQNTVIAPYTPLVVSNNTISLFGRKLEINDDGFPKKIQTFFTQEMTAVGVSPNDILTDPFQFIIEDEKGKLKWKHSAIQYLNKTAGTVTWQVNSTSPEVEMQVDASIEFDGFVSYSVKITASNDVTLKDIRMQIPFGSAASQYMMGLGQKGGLLPPDFDWKWDVQHKNQDGAWIGNVNAGLQFSLRDQNYVRPLNTNFYLQKPLLLPL